MFFLLGLFDLFIVVEMFTWVDVFCLFVFVDLVVMILN